MLPRFPAPTPGFPVFNYWDTGFVWSGAKTGLWLANSDHTGSNQFNYPPIKVKKKKGGPVIAVKGRQWWGRSTRSRHGGRRHEGTTPSCRGCYAQTFRLWWAICTVSVCFCWKSSCRLDIISSLFLKILALLKVVHEDGSFMQGGENRL